MTDEFANPLFVINVSARNVTCADSPSRVHELEHYMRCRQCSEVPRLCLQAQPSGRAANDEDFRQRSGVNVVVGRAVGADERGRQLRRP